MAGSAIKLTVRDTGVERALARLAGEKGSVVVACLKNIGEALLKSTRKRFDEERDPQGKAWAPLNAEYAKGKKGTKILQEQAMRGGLLGTIVYKVSGGRLEVGTNKVYGAIHQLGGTIVPRRADALVFRLNGRVVHASKVTIPARPYLGVSEADKTTIKEIVGDFIDDATKPG